jgi:pyruvate dehydrogenase E2 component (dihydrolipoamide acetyltransferase)
VEAYSEVVASSIRKVIASRLVASKQGAPHLYLTRDAPLDAVNGLRSKLASEGHKHSVNDFVIRAAAVALAKVPAGGAIAPGAAVDISIAVATPNGLMTPIVKAADKLSLGQVSATVKELAQLARDAKLKPDQFQGGSFSVSNLGMFPVDQFAAILNPPQAAILAVGRAEQQVSLGPDGQPRSSTVMAVTLSVDATRVDAVAAAEWMEAFAQALAEPQQLL